MSKALPRCHVEMLKDKWESFSCTPIFLGPNYHALGLLATCPSPPVSFVLASASPSPDPHFGHYLQSPHIPQLSSAPFPCVTLSLRPRPAPLGCPPATQVGGAQTPCWRRRRDKEVATKTPTSPGQLPAVPPRPSWSVGPRLSCYKLPTGQHPWSRLSVPHLPTRQALRLTCSLG